jgi:gephyrin
MSGRDDQGLLKACVLIVSDSVYAGTTTDKSFQGLKEVFENEGAGQFYVSHSHVVPDDKQYIQEVVDGWCDWSNSRFINPNLVITTGGTGFAQRDITPEAVGPLMQRHAPGIV